MGYRLLSFLVPALMLYFLAPSNISASDVDNSIYAGLLNKYVKDGRVDYAGFKKDEALLDQYLKILEKTEKKDLSPEEQFAFYINAYNAWTIKLILTAYPGVKSIKELRSLFQSPWKKKIVVLKEGLLTLDDLEHQIMRPTFKDPRVHFAVNCASKGCPPLRSEPYSGGVLHAQLDEMTAGFINDPAYNRLEGTTLYVSSIFKWYEEDFKEGVTAFFRWYAKGDLKKSIEALGDSVKIKHLDYDWSLNGR
jgi:hypothetical protein